MSEIMFVGMLLIMMTIEGPNGTFVATTQESLNFMKCRVHDDNLNTSCCSLVPRLIANVLSQSHCAKLCADRSGSFTFSSPKFSSNFNFSLVNGNRTMYYQKFKFYLNFLPALLTTHISEGCFGFNFKQSKGLCELFDSFCFNSNTTNSVDFGKPACSYYEVVPFQKTMCFFKGLRDCGDLSSTDPSNSGLYWITVDGLNYPVYCEITNGKKYTIIQRRIDGSVDFYRNWTDYKQGFGDVKGEYWLGNQMLYTLTTKWKYTLRVDLQAYDGVRVYSEYTTFVVNSPATMYTLTVAGYSGNASVDEATDSLMFHNGMMFTTADVDNDQMPYNCAEQYTGAWWYRTCHASNLNGMYLPDNSTLYGQGINWKAFRGFKQSMKFCRMMILRV